VASYPPPDEEFRNRLEILVALFLLWAIMVLSNLIYLSTTPLR
jgi:hypothetical protein